MLNDSKADNRTGRRRTKKVWKLKDVAAPFMVWDGRGLTHTKKKKETIPLTSCPGTTREIKNE